RGASLEVQLRHRDRRGIRAERRPPPTGGGIERLPLRREATARDWTASMAQGIFGPPRLRIGGPDEERHATWLETFFDLVFVVTVSQVADRLTARLSIPAVLEYGALF